MQAKVRKKGRLNEMSGSRPLPTTNNQQLTTNPYLCPMRYFLPLLLFITACGNSESLPQGVLDKDKMIRVLTEVHIAEAEQQQKVLDQEVTAADTFSFQEIFKRENITRAQYNTSMKFYSANPELLDQIYDEVINELSHRQSQELRKKN
jgi:hypothetical protein